MQYNRLMFYIFLSELAEVGSAGLLFRVNILHPGLEAVFIINRFVVVFSRQANHRSLATAHNWQVYFALNDLSKYIIAKLFKNSASYL